MFHLTGRKIILKMIIISIILLQGDISFSAIIDCLHWSPVFEVAGGVAKGRLHI